MKTLKRIKIWKWQAKAWMKVCHRAMESFPNAFAPPEETTDGSDFYYVSPKVAVERVLELLKELAQRRAGTWLEWSPVPETQKKHIEESARNLKAALDSEVPDSVSVRIARYPSKCELCNVTSAGGGISHRADCPNAREFPSLKFENDIVQKPDVSQEAVDAWFAGLKVSSLGGSWLHPGILTYRCDRCGDGCSAAVAAHGDWKLRHYRGQCV